MKHEKDEKAENDTSQGHCPDEPSDLLYITKVEVLLCRGFWFDAERRSILTFASNPRLFGASRYS